MKLVGRRASLQTLAPGPGQRAGVGVYGTDELKLGFWILLYLHFEPPEMFGSCIFDGEEESVI